MDVRARIRQILDEKSLSVRKVSLDAGMSDSMLHKYLTGQTRSITVDNLEGVARALGVSMRFLWFGEDQHENVVYYWDKFNERQRRQALRILETLSDEDDQSAGGAA